MSEQFSSGRSEAASPSLASRGCEPSSVETEDAFDQLMDDTQVLYGLRAGDIISQAEVDALNRLDDYWRKNADDAVEAHAQGLDAGRREAGGVEVAALLDKLGGMEAELITQRMLRRFDEQRLTSAVLDNVRQEIRAEVEYALQLALAGSRHPVASDGEGERSEADRTKTPSPQEQSNG